MCGRFVLTASSKEIKIRYGLKDIISDIKPRFNISPGQMVQTIYYDQDKKLREMKWGLIPNWAKDPKIGYKMINARSETLTEKPSFRKLIKSRRCIVVATGFYEWKKVGTKKFPYLITVNNQKIFSLAGLYDIWLNDKKEEVHTVTIITTIPNEVMADIHDRMPLILNVKNESTWLESGEVNLEEFIKTTHETNLEVSEVESGVFK
jgi:putative SOS response-associated peptidase YedK